MDDKKERDLKDLGIVLGVQNSLIKDALMMLGEQQKRQVRMIWASLAIVLVAFIIVGISMFFAYSSFDKLHNQMQMYHGGIHNEQTQGISEENPH